MSNNKEIIPKLFPLIQSPSFSISSGGNLFDRKSSWQKQSPGPDGFRVEFLIKHWSIFKETFKALMEDFHTNGRLKLHMPCAEKRNGPRNERLPPNQSHPPYLIR